MLNKSLCKKNILNIHKNAPFFKTFSKAFSAGHHKSGNESGSDTHHDHHDEIHPLNFFEDKRIKGRWSTFNHIKSDKFEVLSLIEKLREPIKKETKVEVNIPEHAKSDAAYIEFLAQAFRNVISSKYPDYKSYLNNEDTREEFINSIPNFKNMNEYQKEVHILDAYMRKQVQEIRDQTYRIQIKENSNESLSKEKEKEALEQAKYRQELLINLTKITSEDHKISKTIKNKLKKVMESDTKYAKFVVEYADEIKNRVNEEIFKEENLGYSKQQVINTKNLADLKSPGNPNSNVSSIFAHDHIKIDDFSKNADHIENTRYMDLALYDIVIDQHLRRVRPNNLLDNEEIYTSSNLYKNLFEDELQNYADNTLFEHLCQLDGEFYLKFKEELSHLIKRPDVIDDPNRPIGKHWAEEHKFPHVADRIGWTKFSESPIDKNFLFERVESNPLYQWQPFVQTPFLNPDENLDLEEGETLYENKWAYEWAIFWKIMALTPVAMFYLLWAEWYNTGLSSSFKFMEKFGIVQTECNLAANVHDEKKLEKLNYWGKELLYWQHWLRRLVFYPAAILMVGVFFYGTIRSIGMNRVIKAVFNREKDLVFITVPDHFLSTTVIPVELHYLERPQTPYYGYWKYMPDISGNRYTDLAISDLQNDKIFFFKSNPDYWNHNVKSYFDENTMTHWKGLKYKDADRGIIFNNSSYLTAEETSNYNLVEEEITNAILKHGPIQKHDYNLNLNFSLKKRLAENRMKLLSGVSH